MKTIRIHIRYTQVGDGAPGQRALDLTQEIPATTQGPWTDQILALPDLRAYNDNTITLPGEIAISPAASREEIELEVIPQALEQEMAKRLAAQAEEREKWIAHLDEIATWAAKASTTGILDGQPPFYGNCGSSGPSIRANYRLSNRDAAVALVGEERVSEIEAHLTAVKEHAKKLMNKERARRETEATERKAREEAAKIKKEAAKERRRAETAKWASEHGSKRLCDMLALGRDGWPLYLHERLAADYPHAELDNDGTDSDCLTPSAASLATCWMVAGRMIELEHAASYEQALRDLLNVKFLELDGNRVEVVFWTGYHPGKDPSWGTKTIRWVVGETRKPLGQDYGYDD